MAIRMVVSFREVDGGYVAYDGRRAEAVQADRLGSTPYHGVNYIAGGSITVSMMWITPLEARMSTVVTLAPAT